MGFPIGHKINVGRKHTEKTKEKHKKIARKQWQNPIIRKKMSKAIKQACIARNMRGSNSTRWKGGIKIDKSGYILQFIPGHPYASEDKYVRQHRLVIEFYLKRYLLPKEHTHHLGKKMDNRPHMLMAFASNSAHRRFESGSPVKSEEIIFDGRKIIH